MPLPLRPYPGDEELGKRDDDHKRGTRHPLGAPWQQRQLPHAPLRRTVKRMALAILAVVGLYYFFKNMPTDLTNPRPRPHYDHSGGQRPPVGGPAIPPPSQNPTPSLALDETAEQPQHYYNGPIKFYELAASLRMVTKKISSGVGNKNVLFAAASLKSASILLPIACEMSTKDTNHVHFALMGRDDISMDMLKSVNGMTKECAITYHDARPDLSPVSSDLRMEISCSGAFTHINTYIQPQATFIDVSKEEELFFIEGVKERADSLGRTIIELPEDSEEKLMWTTLLDSASLSVWNKVNIDILVHAPLSSSGSLIRLLESLKDADFFSSAPPRLTIELPHEVDEATRRYLENFRWPPNSDRNTGSLLTLHHRIPQHGLTPEENSIRFLEAFWPANPELSHVLVLSPQAQLSPLFFHYLKYTVLEYKYSSSNMDTRQNLLGVSLDLPSTHINDSAEFQPPSAIGPSGEEATQFLWQAPDSNAALYFGDKWVELHDFVAHSLVSQHALPTPTTLNEKLVSKIYPSWLEHILKLSRARGYWMLYPNFKNMKALATLHTELYQLPEEYSNEPEIPSPDDDSELTGGPLVPHKHAEARLISKSLLTTLPNDGNLPKMIDMPLLAWDGEGVKVADLEQHASKYSRIFQREIGGCDEATATEKKRAGLAAGDLFCLEDKTSEETG